MTHKSKITPCHLTLIPQPPYLANTTLLVSYYRLSWRQLGFLFTLQNLEIKGLQTYGIYINKS